MVTQERYKTLLLIIIFVQVFSSICSNLILFMSLLQQEGVANGAMTSSVEEILAHLFIR